MPKPLQVYTKRSKDVIFTSLRTDPESIVANPDPHHSASLPTYPPLTIQMNISASSDLDLRIAHQKGKQSCTQHPISNDISYDRASASSVLCLSLIRKC